MDFNGSLECQSMTENATGHKSIEYINVLKGVS